MSSQPHYRPPPFAVRWRSLERDAPLAFPASAYVEVSELMPQALISFSVEVPDEMGFNDPFLNCVMRIDPPSRYRDGTQYRFEVWQKIEDQPWMADFAWGESVLDAQPWDTSGTWPLDDLSDALYSCDASGVFEAFSRLAGGQIEFVRPE